MTEEDQAVPRFKFFSIALFALLAPIAARAQELAPEAMCVRYLQNAERTFGIPQGLLTAISLAEAGRSAGEGQPMTAWPWTINVNGNGQFFESKEEAVAAARKHIDGGQRSIDVGCMQVNLRYHPNAFPTVDDAFDPAANVAYGAQFLASLHGAQGSWAKAVERYHSSDDGRREQYRERVLALWNSEARNIVMNAVLAEGTDTPYHRAIRDFVGGRYSEALDKYQAIVDAVPNDRIGLLGIAMSYEELDRDAEAMQAYTRYLVSEPTNQSILSRVIQRATGKAPDAARKDLETILRAGVVEPDLYAALAEISSALGDNEAALAFASDAAAKAPTVPAYHLNAGVFADRLNRSAAAVQFYEQFLALFQRGPSIIDTSVDGVRDRVKFLRTKL